MATFKNVTIVGASGSIGTIILESLISASKFDITVLSRKESEATFPANVTVRKTDFSVTDLELILKGQDVVISALGAAGFQEQRKIVDAAISAGVKRFIPSEFSASSEDEAVLTLLPLFQEKKNLIDYLRSKESSGMSWTGIATGLLFDWGLANGFLEFDIKGHKATIWDDGNKKFTLTNKKQLGQAVVSVLGHPQETSNRYIYVYSVATTQNEILTSLERETGAKWKVDSTTTQEQVSEARKKLGAGDFSGAFALVRGTAFSDTPGLRADYTTEADVANDLLGLTTETVRDTVGRVTAE